MQESTLHLNAPCDAFPVFSLKVLAVSIQPLDIGDDLAFKEVGFDASRDVGIDEMSYREHMGVIWATENLQARHGRVDCGRSRQEVIVKLS